MEEWTALAELHAADPTLLIHRIRESIKTMAARAPIDEAFRETAVKDLPALVSEIKRTPDLAAHIFSREKWDVADRPELAFWPIGREVSPLRSKLILKEERADRRSLDLLLGNICDSSLIVAEAKINDDSPTYPALIQALMYAVEMATAAQLRRVRDHLDAASISVHPPRFDIYLIAIRPLGQSKPSAIPKAPTNRERIDVAAEKIAKQLVDVPDVNARVRRIAYINGTVETDGLNLRWKYSYTA